MFKQYYNPLCNFASSILDDRRFAQDVVQDVFAQFWSKKEELVVNDNIKSYLFSAVKNRSLEILRKNKVNAKMVDSYSVDSDKTELNNVADHYLKREKLYKAIKQLPPKCQEVFLLNKIDGLTYKEIASNLDISVKTVENHIGKAYRILREMVSGDMAAFKS